MLVVCKIRHGGIVWVYFIIFIKMVTKNFSKNHPILLRFKKFLGVLGGQIGIINIKF